MRTRLALMATVCLPLLGGATTVAAQHAASTHNPVGTFDVAFVNHGQEQPAVLTVTRQADGRLEGTLQVHGQTMTMSSISQKNRDLILVASSDNGELTLSFTFKSADKLEGTYDMEGMGSGKVTAERRKS